MFRNRYVMNVFIYMTSEVFGIGLIPLCTHGTTHMMSFTGDNKQIKLLTKNFFFKSGVTIPASEFVHVFRKICTQTNGDTDITN